MTVAFDPYTVLQVQPSAETDVIRAAYRALARVHHPDRSADPGAAAAMIRINAAWEILGDPTRRAAFDRSAPVSATPDPGTRSAPRREPAGATPNGRPGWRVGPDGEGAAGPPPGRPSGSMLDFGRHIGWSLGEVARVDPGYLLWLIAQRRGARYRDEVLEILGRSGAPKRGAAASSPGRRPSWSGVLGR